MDRWKGRVALIMGASSGIGAALVKDLAAHGMTVVGCSRNIENIQKLGDSLKDVTGAGHVIPIKCDLITVDDIAAMFSRIQKEAGRLDVCVNSAGLTHPGLLQDGATEHWREMLELNVLALSICTREALKMMKANNIPDGHIIHIGSMSGHRVVGGDASFSACTKHAVKALTEGLRRELRLSNADTRITSISPGNVDTEFRARKYGHDAATIKEKTPHFKELDAKDISDAVIYALSAPPHVQIFDVLLRPNHQPT